MDYLLDSNVIIDYFGDKFNHSINARLEDMFESNYHISVISKIEVLGFELPDFTEKIITGFFDNGIMYHISDNIISRTINLRKKYNKLKLPDAIIAATALENNLVLITANYKDFIIITELSLLNPYTLTQ